MAAGELERRRAREQRLAAERSAAAAVARDRRRRRAALGLLATLGVGALIAGALAGGVAVVAGIAVLVAVVAVGVWAGRAPNRPEDQARSSLPWNR
jgi:multisubunit Na+/H+ antiporter MnhB subunit